MTESWSQSPGNYLWYLIKAKFVVLSFKTASAICEKGSNHRGVSVFRWQWGRGTTTNQRMVSVNQQQDPGQLLVGGWGKWTSALTTGHAHSPQLEIIKDRGWLYWKDGVGINKDCSVSSRLLVRLWLDCPLVPRVHMCCLIIFLYNLLKNRDDLDVQVF